MFKSFALLVAMTIVPMLVISNLILTVAAHTRGLGA